VIFLQGRLQDLRVETASFLDLVRNASLKQDLFQIFRTGQASVSVGETKERFDTLVPAQGLEGAPATPAWRPITHPTIHRNIDLSTNFPSGRPEKQPREKRDQFLHRIPSRVTKLECRLWPNGQTKTKLVIAYFFGHCQRRKKEKGEFVDVFALNRSASVDLTARRELIYRFTRVDLSVRAGYVLAEREV
jgi:hypothetical protein